MEVSGQARGEDLAESKLARALPKHRSRPPRSRVSSSSQQRQPAVAPGPGEQQGMSSVAVPELSCDPAEVPGT